MRAVLVANPKGGCGKTTLATNLAAGLSHRDERVALWDLDRQKSSLEWLALRPSALPPISALGRKDDLDERLPRKSAWLIIDSPAGLHGKNLSLAIKPVQHVLVPIQPSLFDMAATRDFLAVLKEEKKARKHENFIGIVGMRVDPRTRAAATLKTFLGQFDLPIVAHIRDTQHYANAAFTGQSIFDLPPYLGERDAAQWEPLLTWLEG
jgi:chromosome partitioning protein